MTIPGGRPPAKPGAPEATPSFELELDLPEKATGSGLRATGGDAAAGKNAFFSTNYTVAGPLQCNSCHTGPPGPGSDRLIIPALALQESQDFKVPQLRAIYQKMHFNNAPGTNTIGGFGIVHDGQDPSLQVFLSRAVFANTHNRQHV